MSNYYNVTNILDKSYRLLAKQIPNPTELTVMSVMKSQIESFFNTQIHHYLGDAQFSRVVIADLIKTGKTVAVVAIGAERGNTGFNYTTTHLLSDVVKIGCRAAVIGSYYEFQGVDAIPHAAAVSNYVCEVPSRYVVNADDAAQAGNYAEKGAWYSITHHLSLYNVFRATSNGALKVSGLYFASMGVDLINPSLKSLIIGPAPMHIVMSVATEMVRTMIMVTVSRLCMTTADFLLEKAHDLAKQTYESFTNEIDSTFNLDKTDNGITYLLSLQGESSNNEL